MTSYVKITPADIARMSKMRHATALVWMRLLIYGGRDGIAWPKQADISQELGLSKQAVSRAYRDLKDLRLMQVQQRRAHSMQDLATHGPICRA